MENYIAIDNVCAWPNLTPMLDGSITAVIFSQPTHGRWQGDVECWGSEDEGCTWSLRGVPAPHEAGTVRLNVAGAWPVMVRWWSSPPVLTSALPRDKW